MLRILLEIIAGGTAAAGGVVAVAHKDSPLVDELLASPEEILICFLSVIGAQLLWQSLKVRFGIRGLPSRLSPGAFAAVIALFAMALLGHQLEDSFGIAATAALLAPVSWWLGQALVDRLLPRKTN